MQVHLIMSNRLINYIFVFFLNSTDLSAILPTVERSQGLLPFLASVLQMIPGNDGQQLNILLASINVSSFCYNNVVTG